MRRLSKSRYIKGLQCDKRLYHEVVTPEIVPEPDAQQEYLFSVGHKIGELAKEVFPSGEDLSPDNPSDWSEAIARTEELLKQDDVIIYEAAFFHLNVLVAVDVLVKKNGKVHMYEVKASTSPKGVYIEDAVLQGYIISDLGYTVGSVNLLLLNKKYVRKGALDIHDLFTVVNLEEYRAHIEPDIAGRIAHETAVINAAEPPEVAIGPHCNSPYECPLKVYCWEDIPENSVFELTRGGSKSWELYAAGIVDLEEVPEEVPVRFSEAQRVQIQSLKEGELIIDKVRVTEFLEQLEYPIYHLDFETVMPPVPMWNGRRPYQQSIVQYSIHVEYENGDIEHKEWLAPISGEDPEREAAHQLIQDVGTEGTILTYNASFERGRIGKLTELFPDLKPVLIPVINRIADLHDPFAAFHIYHPAQRGSTSIKSVLPAFVPELTYDDLSINNGHQSSSIFLQLMQSDYKQIPEGTYEALSEYCKLDTWAMVKLLAVLRKLVG